MGLAIASEIVAAAMIGPVARSRGSNFMVAGESESDGNNRVAGHAALRYTAKGQFSDGVLRIYQRRRVVLILQNSVTVLA